MVRDGFDDYGYGEDHDVSIGDEISAIVNDIYNCGTVVGIIRNSEGDPVCYKIWGRYGQGFDYIQASDVTMCEPCGSSDWALRRIGYELKERSDGGAYVCEITGDVIQW